ncbi:MAG: hypothetical protein ACYDAE_24120 [Steroidobacteraceae bacterium]
MKTLLGPCTRPAGSAPRASWALPLRLIVGAHFGQPGYETDLLYLACLAALVLGGNGPLALDSVLLRGMDNRPRGAAEPIV